MSEDCDEDAHCTKPSRTGYRNYNAATLSRAFKAVKEEKVPVTKAAKIYGVPITTLRDRILGNIKLETFRSGPEVELGKDIEEKLVDHILSLQKRGAQVTRADILTLANDFAVELNIRERNKPFSLHWYYGFVKRWPQLDLVKSNPGSEKAKSTAKKRKLANKKASQEPEDNSQNGKQTSLQTERVEQSVPDSRELSPEDLVQKYFKDLQDTTNKYKLSGKPECIYHVDDKGLIEYHHPQTNIVSRPSDVTQSICKKLNTISVIGGGNALGHQIPPYFIFEKCLPPTDVLTKCPPGTGFASSESGWATASIIKEYLENHFMRYAQGRNIDQPVVLIYNGLKAYYLHHNDWARENNIIMFASPIHAAKAVYPYSGPDCFGPFDILYNCMRFQHLCRSNSPRLNVGDMCRIAGKAYEAAVTPANLRKSFAKCGTFPYSPSSISQTTESRLSVLHPVGPVPQVSVLLSQTPHSSHRADTTAESRVSQNGALSSVSTPTSCSKTVEESNSSQSSSSASESEDSSESSSSQSSSRKSSPRKQTGKRTNRQKRKTTEGEVVLVPVGDHGDAGVVDMESNLCGMCIASTITI